MNRSSDIADDLYTREMQRVHGADARQNGDGPVSRPLTEDERKHFERKIASSSRNNGDASLHTLEDLDSSLRNPRDNGGVSALTIARPNPADDLKSPRLTRSESMARKNKRDNRYTQAEISALQDKYSRVGFPAFGTADGSLPTGLAFEQMQGLSDIFRQGKAFRRTQRVRTPDGYIEGGSGEFNPTTKKFDGKRTQNWYLGKIADGGRSAIVRVVDSENNISFPEVPLYISLRPQAGPVLPENAQKGRIVRYDAQGNAIVQSVEDRKINVRSEVTTVVAQILMALRSRTSQQAKAALSRTQYAALERFAKSAAERGGRAYVSPQTAAQVRSALQSIIDIVQSRNFRFVEGAVLPSLLPNIASVLRIPVTEEGLPSNPNLGRAVSAASIAKAKATREANMTPSERARRERAAAERAAKAQAREEKLAKMTPAQREKYEQRLANLRKGQESRVAGAAAKRKGRSQRLGAGGSVARAPGSAPGTIVNVNTASAPAEATPAPAVDTRTPQQKAADTRARNRAAAGEIPASSSRRKRDNSYGMHRDNGLVDGLTSLAVLPAVGGLAAGALLGVPASNFVASKNKMAVKVAGGVLGVYGLAAAVSPDGRLMDRVKIAPSNDTHRSLLAFGAIGLALPMLFEGLRDWATSKLPAGFAKIGVSEPAPAAGFGSIYDFAGTGLYEAVNPRAQLSAFGESELDDIDDVDPALEGLSAYVAEQQGTQGLGEYVAASGLGATVMSSTGGFGEDGVKISVPNYLNGLGEEIDPEEMFAFEGLGEGVTVTAGNALTGLGVMVEGGVAGLGEDDLDDDDLEDLSGLGEADMDDEDLDLEGLGAVARRRSAARRAAASGRASGSARAAAAAKIVRMTPSTINKIASSSKMRRVVAIRVLRKSTRVPNTFIVAIGKSKREAVPAPGAILRKPDTMGINPAPVGQERFQPGGVFAENVFGKKIL